MTTRRSLLTIGLLIFSGSAHALEVSVEEMQRRTAEIATRYIAVWSSDA